MSKSERRLYEFGDFRLDASERLLSRRGVTVPLPPKAIDLLLALVDQPGRLLDRETLLNTVWPDSFVEENNLADNIFKLRRVLGDGENGTRFIETVPKRGYRFVADVRAVGPLTEQAPELRQQVLAERPRQTEEREGQVPLPATSTWRAVSLPWLVAGAISSDESGRFEVYVESFPTRGGKRQISLGGGSGPRWRADGKELYFHSLDGKLMAVSVTADGATLTTGTPTALFSFRPASAVTVPSYAVTRNGQRFLLSAVLETDTGAALSVVQNWTEGLKR